mmetsp:Transcript_57782/g.161219  ORF Transcript_57782/g.161219 Transcript_57782/m.161219 type:complete len:209 (-) Transcript_57782:47-673(-)
MYPSSASTAVVTKSSLQNVSAKPPTKSSPPTKTFGPSPDSNQASPGSSKGRSTTSCITPCAVTSSPPSLGKGPENTTSAVGYDFGFPFGFCVAFPLLFFRPPAVFSRCAADRAVRAPSCRAAWRPGRSSKVWGAPTDAHASPVRQCVDRPGDDGNNGPSNTAPHDASTQIATAATLVNRDDDAWRPKSNVRRLGHEPSIWHERKVNVQ